ncbi:MAG: ArsA family ATPase [Proteobacteria bacterium]|nr:ArsA family ATPase [Pseudomonadota bacterium]MBU1583042.1 ArsA family ATPase [Pseudomonadota bacterium]MBU2452617.1 ArsA family ATPase [Pseudomonadota bacterium]MBU2629777.1 ArsA family ATPase [Pseudomonadota bacterium]
MKKLPEYLENSNLRLLIFGGKGGTGKTTMSSAAAVWLAKANPLTKVMIISTDPAHSLSHGFGVKLDNQSTCLIFNNTSESNLYAKQLDAQELTAQFKQENGDIMKKIASRGTYFDQKDISEFFDLSLPGMDEVMAIIEVAQLLSENLFDVLIIDTAPTGHTLRMLNLPFQMEKWIQVMDMMLEKHRYMATQFTRRKYVKDECDFFLEGLTQKIHTVNNLLKDQQITRFIPVMIPEFMSIQETQKLVKTLLEMHIPVKEIIVNHVAVQNVCEFCTARKFQQANPILQIQQEFSKFDLIFVENFQDEIKGYDDLSLLGNYLTGNFYDLYKKQELQKHEAIIQDTDQTMKVSNPDFDPDIQFVIIGGKGGVGKTTVASSIGLYLSGLFQDKKILLFSTDPAHSLSDSLDLEIGNCITPVSSNLWAMEMNADQLFEDFKNSYKQDIYLMFDQFLTKGMDIKFDREVMAELFSMAPPGLDEIMAINKIMDLKLKNEFDMIIIDSSPTGHLLRFLELPGLVRQWLKTLFNLLIKYEGIVKLTRSAQKALDLSKNIRRIQENLTDPKKTAFVLVAISEAMGVLESEDLSAYLTQAKIPLAHLFINMVLPDTDCPVCAVRQKSQKFYIEKIKRKFAKICVWQIPLFPHEIHGKTNLKKFMNKLFKLDQ